MGPTCNSSEVAEVNYVRLIRCPLRRGRKHLSITLESDLQTIPALAPTLPRPMQRPPHRPPGSCKLRPRTGRGDLALQQCADRRPVSRDNTHAIERELRELWKGI